MQDSTVQDLYPTRTAELIDVFDRKGPVVHGTAEDGPMDADTLHRQTG